MEANDAHQQQLQALQDAVRALMLPLAQLAVARGLPFVAAEDLLKQAFVQAASDAHPGLLPHRKVSRISTVTGINRREVTRLTQAEAPPPRRRSLPAEVFAHWLSDARYRHDDGRPLVLPRQGSAPSFETLAHTITRDVHPRSLLDELLRLGLASHDAETDTVSAARDAVPRGDSSRMLAFLGDNVGDHLRAAVANVLGDGKPHFEQALFADGLSDATMDWLREAVRGQWAAMRQALVPELEKRLEADGQQQPAPTRRWRVGLYNFDETGAAQAPATEPAPRQVARKRIPKAKP